MVSHQFPYENGHFAITSPGQMEHKNHIKPPSNTGWWLTYPSEKYSSNGSIIPNIWREKKGSKPPTKIFPLPLRFNAPYKWTEICGNLWKKTPLVYEGRLIFRCAKSGENHRKMVI